MDCPCQVGSSQGNIPVMATPHITKLTSHPSVHAPAYPLPTSFPSFFKSPRLNASGRGGLLAPTRSAPLFTSVVTGSGTADLFSTYARFVEDCVRRKADVGVGVDRDELRDLGNDLWTLHDNFADGNTGLGGNDDDSMGEDEE